jgi:hypothetical protein
MRTPKHFVNIMGRSKKFKMLEFPLNQLQMNYGYLSDLFYIVYVGNKYV